MDHHIARSPPSRSPKITVPLKSPKLQAKARGNDRSLGPFRGPKKAGAGGKGTWGIVTDTDGPAALDKADPNYDSDEEAYFLQEIPGVLELNSKDDSQDHSGEAASL